MMAQIYVQSQQTIPQYHLPTECKVDALTALRVQLNEEASKRQGGKLSVTDFVIKASAVVNSFPRRCQTQHSPP